MKWTTQKRKVNELLPYTHNPRQMTEKQNKDLEVSLKKFDLVEIPAINQDNTILAGHQRLRIMLDLGRGEEEIDVRVPDRQLTEKEVQEYNIRSNKNTGEWDYESLANNFEVGELLEWGFDEKELKIEKNNLEELNGTPNKDIKDIKILNLYSSIGGNRRLWGDLDITAVEYNPEIAEIYKDYFPNDKVIVTDAHKFLEEHFEEYDFIWASPPYPTHSRLRKGLSIAAGAKPIYPDMRLWQEILFLQGYFKGKWVVENVITWYDPLIEPQEKGRHYYWSNFDIPDSDIFNVADIGNPGTREYGEKSKKYGFNLDKYKVSSKYPKDKILRDIVPPEVGKYILECAYGKS